MKCNLTIRVFLCALMGFAMSAAAVVITDPLYRAEVFATYSNPAIEATSSGIVFDDQGNLYISHISGHVYKVAPNRNATLFAKNTGAIRDMVWTGGTVYGNEFYVSSPSDNLIKKIDRNGTITDFATIERGPVALELDRIGKYGGLLFSGMNVRDRIDYVLPNGSNALFSPFPYNNIGGVEGLAFDPGSRYGGLLYTGIFSNDAASYRGVYSIDPLGNPVKFSQNLAWAQQIEFDLGVDFGGFMFVIGANVLGGDKTLWKMDENGNASLFAESDIWQIGGFCFGPDGAMYISEFTYNGRVSTISRITLIPEPASGFLLFFGACLFVNRKRVK